MPRQRLAKYIGLFAFVSATAIAAVHWLSTSHGAAAEPQQHGASGVPVIASIATRRDMPAILKAIGTVEPVETVSVEPRVNGQVAKVYFTQGREVKAGDPLFLIDPRPYQAALDQARGQLAHDQALLDEASADLGRYQVLARQDSIAQQQVQDQSFLVQQDKSTVQLDEANVEAASLNLGYCHINSPTAGLAGPLLVDPGNYVQAGTNTNLVTITELQPIYVSFSVPQATLDEVRSNQAKGALEVDAYSPGGQEIAAGRLTLIDNDVNTSTGTVMLEGTFANKDTKLWPGEYVSVRLVLFMRKDAVTVPEGAVMAGPNGGSYVYVIQPNDTVRRANVTVAARQDNLAVISRGLAGGERVVASGQYRLANNVKIAIQPSGGGLG